jgi:hypothetical protein
MESQVVSAPARAGLRWFLARVVDTTVERVLPKIADVEAATVPDHAAFGTRIIIELALYPRRPKGVPVIGAQSQETMAVPFSYITAIQQNAAVGKVGWLHLVGLMVRARPLHSAVRRESNLEPRLACIV